MTLLVMQCLTIQETSYCHHQMLSLHSCHAKPMKSRLTPDTCTRRNASYLVCLANSWPTLPSNSSARCLRCVLQTSDRHLVRTELCSPSHLSSSFYTCRSSHCIRSVSPSVLSSSLALPWCLCRCFLWETPLCFRFQIRSDLRCLASCCLALVSQLLSCLSSRKCSRLLRRVILSMQCPMSWMTMLRASSTLQWALARQSDLLYPAQLTLSMVSLQVKRCSEACLPCSLFLTWSVVVTRICSRQATRRASLIPISCRTQIGHKKKP